MSGEEESKKNWKFANLTCLVINYITLLLLLITYIQVKVDIVPTKGEYSSHECKWYEYEVQIISRTRSEVAANWIQEHQRQ